MTNSGERCVMMIGTSEMLRWCAKLWTVEQHRYPNLVPSLGKAKDLFGWMMSPVPVMRLPFCTANAHPLEKITVAMAKMQAWCVQVSNSIYYLIYLSVVTPHIYLLSLMLQIKKKNQLIIL